MISFCLYPPDRCHQCFLVGHEQQDPGWTGKKLWLLWLVQPYNPGSTRLCFLHCSELVCKSRSPTCQMCGEKFLKHSDEALKILGGVGLFFSFTEILGVWLAMRFWNQKDPQANPSAFLWDSGSFWHLFCCLLSLSFFFPFGKTWGL